MTKDNKITLLETRNLPVISKGVYETLGVEINNRTYSLRDLSIVIDKLHSKNPILSDIISNSIPKITCAGDALWSVLAILKLIDIQLEVDELNRIMG
jgi:hypothetical protein